VTAESPDPDDLRAEYAVIGSYITAMTGMRFQTVTIFLAAVGLIASGGNQSPRTGLLILVLSVGLWILDLRNREVLKRLGDRGIQIEEREWHYKDQGAAGSSGFFLDRDKRAGIRLLSLGPLVPPDILGRFLSHAFAIDVVFLGVAGYAIALLI
jgi:hypothetical protein